MNRVTLHNKRIILLCKARTAVGILLEWRGISWSIGGDGNLDSGVFTLPSKFYKFVITFTPFYTHILHAHLSAISNFTVNTIGVQACQFYGSVQKHWIQNDRLCIPGCFWYDSIIIRSTSKRSHGAHWAHKVDFKSVAPLVTVVQSKITWKSGDRQ